MDHVAVLSQIEQDFQKCPNSDSVRDIIEPPEICCSTRMFNVSLSSEITENCGVVFHLAFGKEAEILASTKTIFWSRRFCSERHI